MAISCRRSGACAQACYGEEHHPRPGDGKQPCTDSICKRCHVKARRLPSLVFPVKCSPASFPFILVSFHVALHFLRDILRPRRLGRHGRWEKLRCPHSHLMAWLPGGIYSLPQLTPVGCWTGQQFPPVQWIQTYCKSFVCTPLLRRYCGSFHNYTIG